MKLDEVTATQRPLAPTGDRPLRLRELFEEHGPFVCRSLRRLGIAEADLDDMLQEVFLVVYNRLADYQERDRVRSWLYSICVHVARAQRRRLFRRRENVTANVPEELVSATQLTSVEDREALVLGQRLLDLLSPEQREIFVLYEVEDMPMQEIVDVLGCPLQTGYSRLKKARERILHEVERAREAAEREGEQT